MDRKKILLSRMQQIAALPLEDREAIPHERFVELTKEFLSLNDDLKALNADNAGNAAGNDKAAR